MSAPTKASMNYAREGEIRVVDTNVLVWEETVDDKAMLWVFRSVLARLQTRGWTIRQDPETLKHYRCLAPGTRIGVKGDLHLYAATRGRMAEFEIHQELAVENRNGGRYDFCKFARMPRRDMRTACVVEMTAIARKLVEVGYSLTKEHFSGDAGPRLLSEMLRVADGWSTHFADERALDHFNRGWTGARFERDETGWPSPRELRSWSTTDRDGLPLHTGAVRYARVNGRLARGRVYGGINGQWWLVDGADRVIAYLTARDLFDCDPAREPRRLVRRQRERLHTELEKATKAKDYARSSVLGGVLARMTKSEEDA